jgi:hypothetical protein
VSAPRLVKVFLSGEGANELGSRAGHRAYQSDERPGVLHTLLARIQPHGWEVGGATTWARIRKYRVRGAHADTGNVLGVAVDAIEAGCHVLAFSRDVDDDPDRERAIEVGLARIPAEFSERGPPDVIGGAAVPAIEGWILALLGQRGTESLGTKKAVRALVDKGVEEKDGTAMVAVAAEADLDAIPTDAASLRKWLERGRGVLPRKVKEMDESTA